MDVVGVQFEKLRLALDAVVLARNKYLTAIQAAEHESGELSVLLKGIIQQPHIEIIDCEIDG